MEPQSSQQPTSDQLVRERSIQIAMLLDGGLIALVLLVGIIGSSFTLIAECVRGTLMVCTELFSFIAMRRIHRGQLAEMEFGAGKLEQMTNLTIAAGMVFGAIWICSGAITFIMGDRQTGTP